MKSKLYPLFLSYLFFCFGFSLNAADIVRLKNGSIRQGKVLLEDEEKILLAEHDDYIRYIDKKTYSASRTKKLGTKTKARFSLPVFRNRNPLLQIHTRESLLRSKENLPMRILKETKRRSTLLTKSYRTSFGEGSVFREKWPIVVETTVTFPLLLFLPTNPRSISTPH